LEGDVRSAESIKDLENVNKKIEEVERLLYSSKKELFQLKEQIVKEYMGNKNNLGNFDKSNSIEN
jgi:ribosomal protein L29